MATYALGDSLIHRQLHSPSSWNIKRDFYEDVKACHDVRTLFFEHPTQLSILQLNTCNWLMGFNFFVISANFSSSVFFFSAAISMWVFQCKEGLFGRLQDHRSFYIDAKWPFLHYVKHVLQEGCIDESGESEKVLFYTSVLVPLGITI